MSSEEGRQAITLDEALDDDDEDSDPTEYEESIREKQEKTEEEEEHKIGQPNYAIESEGPEALEDVRDTVDDSTVTISTPDWLSDSGAAEEDFRDPRDRPSGLPGYGEIDLGDIQSILNEMQVGGDLALDPDDLGNLGLQGVTIDVSEVLSGLDLDELTAGDAALIRLLSALLQVGANILQLSRINAQVNLATAVGIADIVDNVSPRSNITVSGTNELTTTSEPVPVVPQSDEEDIPTRFLIVKADKRNTEEILIGDDDISPSSGYVLSRGQQHVFNIDLRGEELYMASSQSGQQVHLLGMV